MSKVKFKTNIGGHFKLRRMPTLVALSEFHGRKWMDAANATLPEGEGYMMSSSQGRRNPQGRWSVRVYTASNHAKRSNAIHNTLVRIISAG